MRYFGTDGVRGLANRELTPELAFNLGLATGMILKAENLAHTVLIGRDTRISGQMLQGALTAGFCSAGINVIDGGVLTTPAVAFLARSREGCAGAVVSASHNPAEDNGIKFFSHEGYKFADETLEAIEAIIEDLPGAEERPVGQDVGWVKSLPDCGYDYVDFLVESLDTSLEGLLVVTDCANGAASNWGPLALRRAGAQVISINDQPDGWNINKKCGSTHTAALQEAVLTYQADLGIAFDGDADRLIAVDHLGNEVDGDQILVALGFHLENQGLLGGKIVITVMSNLGLKLAFKKTGIEVLETPVGDRFVLQEMLEKEVLLGGEQSGHIILTKAATTGDGILTALTLMGVMKETGQDLATLAGQMEKLPQVLINVPVASKEGWEDNPRIIKAQEEIEKKLADKGRLLVRASGTEAKIRVMAEGPDPAELEEMARGLAEIIRGEQGG